MAGESRLPTVSTDEEVRDGVHRYPRSGIKVVIVGGGVGGLMAALECWRKGHEVVVLERTDTLSPLGDGFTLSPNGLTSFKYYPTLNGAYSADFNDAILKLMSLSGTEIRVEEAEWKRSKVPHSSPETSISFIKSRSYTVKLLYDQAAALGIPILFGQRVVRYREDPNNETASVETDRGTVFSGDVVIAADGIRTKSDIVVSGGPVKAMESGYAIARASFNQSSIMPGSLGARLLEKIHERGEFRMYVGEDVHLILAISKSFAGFGFTHKDHGTAEESWHNEIPSAQLIEMIKQGGNLDPEVVNLLEQVPKITDWKLVFRDPQRLWVSLGGRIIQLGDAAHSFLPTSGNGGTQALEDAVSIAECLRLGGKKNVQWSTRVHNKLRFERVSVVQRLGFIHQEGLHNFKPIEDDRPSDGVTMPLPAWGKWLWAHDPELYALEKFEEANAHLRTGSAFANTNLPPGHVFEPWTMESELARMEKGIPSVHKQNGDWSF